MVVKTEMLCWWERSKENGQTGWSREICYATMATQITAVYSCGKQKSTSEWTARRTSRWMDSNSRSPRQISWQLRTEMWSSGYKCTKTGQLNTRWTLSGRANQDFCWCMKMVESEFGIKHKSPSLQLLMCQQSRLVVVYRVFPANFWLRDINLSSDWRLCLSCCWLCVSIYGHKQHDKPVCHCYSRCLPGVHVCFQSAGQSIGFLGFPFSASIHATSCIP